MSKHCVLTRFECSCASERTELLMRVVSSVKIRVIATAKTTNSGPHIVTAENIRNLCLVFGVEHSVCFFVALSGKHDQVLESIGNIFNNWLWQYLLPKQCLSNPPCCRRRNYLQHWSQKWLRTKRKCASWLTSRRIYRCMWPCWRLSGSLTCVSHPKASSSPNRRHT